MAVDSIHGIPTQPPKSGSPVRILAKHNYWDLVQAWVKKPLDAKDRKFLRRHSARVTVWANNQLPGWRYRVVIFQPDEEALKYLDRKYGKDVLINRIESTADLITTDSASAEVLKRFLDNHLVQKNRRARQLGGFDGTSYWCKERWVTRQPVVYIAPDGSKVANDAPPCVRVEIRVCKARAVQGVGVYRFADLVGYDHPGLWRRTIDFVAVDLAGLGRAARYASGDKRRRLSDPDHDVQSGHEMVEAAQQFDDAGQPRRADITTQEIIDGWRDYCDLRPALISLDHDWLLPEPEPKPKP